MTTIYVTQPTTATHADFVAPPTDLRPCRSELFVTSSAEYLTVQERGPRQADVTEVSGGVWERLHYNWTDPENIVLTTTESNLWSGASGCTYTFTPRADDGTDVHAVVVVRARTSGARSWPA
jgi:hypothetical protein